MISLRGAIGRMTLFTSLLVCIGGVAADPAPVPSGPQLDAAMQSVKVIYADRASNAKTTSDRAALAREVFADRHATSTHA